MAGLQDEWLVVVDMQAAFANSDSPWFTPGFRIASEQIASLLPLFEPDDRRRDRRRSESRDQTNLQSGRREQKQAHPALPERVIFTRFIPPKLIEGSWDAYYRKWVFATDRNDAALWGLVAPWQDRPTLDTHRFSKWGGDLQRLTGPAPTLVLCGVSTDCCVLATAFAAVDDGAFVRVVADACAAKTPAIHDGALSLLRSRSPQLVISSVEEERERLVAAP